MLEIHLEDRPVGDVQAVYPVRAVQRVGEPWALLGGRGDQQQHRCEEALRRFGQQTLQTGVDESSLFRDADTEHRNEHYAKRRETREGSDHAG